MSSEKWLKTLIELISNYLITFVYQSIKNFHMSTLELPKFRIGPWILIKVWLLVQDLIYSQYLQGNLQQQPWFEET